MLHVEVVSLVAIDSPSVEVTGVFGASNVLPQTRVAIDAAKHGVVNKEFFIKLPAKSDLVFKVVLANGSVLQSQLSKDYLSSVALSVSQAKTVHLKSTTGGPAVASGLKVKLDFVVPKFEEEKTESAEDLDERYAALIECVKASSHEHRSLLSEPSGSELLRPTRSLMGSRADGGRPSIAVAEAKTTMLWEKSEFCSVSRVLVRVGSPVMPGTPLLELSMRSSSSANSDNDVEGYAPDDVGDAGPVANHYKEATGIGLLKHESSRTGYLTDEKADTESDIVIAVEDEESSEKTITLCWTQNHVGIVSELFVKVDTV